MGGMRKLTIALLLLALAPSVQGEDDLPEYRRPESLQAATSTRPALVAGLIDDIILEYPGRSEEAWKVLAALGRPAMGAVIDALPKASWLGRSHLISALVQSRIPEVEPVLLAAATDPAWAVREAAASGLAFTDSPEGTTTLLGLTGDSSWRVRGVAVRALRIRSTRGVAESSAVIAALLSRTADPDRDVRLATLAELGHLRADRARQAFLEGFAEDDEEIHDVCFKALTELEDAREDLIAAMEKALDSSEDQEFLEAAEKYTELTGSKILENEGHVSRLLYLLRTHTQNTARVLRKMGRPVVPLLLENLRRFYGSPGRIPAQGDFGATVLDVIQEILKEDAVPVLDDILRTWEQALPARRHAVALASRYHARALVPTFKELYRKDSFADLRAALLQGIAAAEDPELVQFVRLALLSGELYMKRTARRILEQHPDLDVGDALATAAEEETGSGELAATFVRLLITREHEDAVRLAQMLLKRPDPEFRSAGAGPLRFLPDAALALTLLTMAYREEDGRDWDRPATQPEDDESEEDLLRYDAERQRVIRSILLSARIAGGEQALPLISEAASDRDPVVREAALLAAAKIPAAGSMDLALRLIESETNPAVTSAALRVLVTHEDPRAQAVLTRRLRGADTAERIEVLRALRRSEQALIPPALLLALAEGAYDEESRLIAVEALQLRGNAEHAEVLAKLVREDPSLNVRSAAVRALGATGSPAASAVLIELLPTPEEGFVGELAELQTSAVEVLGELGARTAVDPLLALLDREWALALDSPEEDSRHFLAADLLLTAVARTGDERAVPTLVDMLFSPPLYRSFALLGASPPRERRSLLGGLIRALVRYPDGILEDAVARTIEERKTSGDAYRINKGYLIYVAGLLNDPRREEIRLPRPRRKFAARIYELALAIVPRGGAMDLEILDWLSRRAAGRHEFDAAAALHTRRIDILRILDPTVFREEEDYLRADGDFLAGMAIAMTGNEEEGYRLYDRGRERDPEDAQILNLAAWYLADTGRRLPKALEDAMAAGQRAPSDPMIIDTIGWALHRLGRHRDAVRHLGLAVTLDIEAAERTAGRLPDPLLMIHLAAAWSRGGFPGNAATCLARAVAMDDTLAIFALTAPDFEPIREGGLLEKAIEEGLKAIPR
jgi:HEAT repeat protein/tetratricopeptide (TPR) repeat protein